MTAGRARATTLLGLLGGLLSACTPSAGRVAEERAVLAAAAGDHVRADLEDALARMRAATGGAEAALAGADSAPRARFHALEALRREAGVDGLAWEGPGGETVWAGRPVEGGRGRGRGPGPGPTPGPWRGSFRSGDLAWHDGPYLKALLTGPVPVRGGYLTATVILEERRPGDLQRPFATRWLDPLGLEGVAVLPPGVERVPEGPLVEVAGPEGRPALVAALRLPGEQAVRERMEARRARWVGLLLLALGSLGVAALVLVLLRARLPGPVRWISLALLALLARTGLGALSPADRWPSLARGFDPTDFGIEDPLGWLGSPADLALTAAACLLAAAALWRALAPVGAPRGWMAACGGFLLGVGFAGAAAALWATVVRVAVAQGQTRFFEVPSFIPRLPAALLLGGLVALTAASFLLVRTGLCTAAASLRGRAPAGLAAAGAAALLASWLDGGAPPVWAGAILPLAAAPFLLRPQDRPGLGLPSRVLLGSVLATGLLFPLLWHQVNERREVALRTAVEDLLRHEVTATGIVRLDLEALRSDPSLRAALADARGGPRPDGLAFHAWLGSSLEAPGVQGVVSILGARGQELDRFALTPIPAGRIPPPAFPSAPGEDLEVRSTRGEGPGTMDSVVGRLRLRSEEGEVLGGVVITVPDRMDLALFGVGGVAGSTDPRAAESASVRLTYAVLRDGRVLRASDPGLPRERGAFGPPDLATLGPDHPWRAWRTSRQEGFAAWSESRGAVVAVRREAPGAGDALLALARLVVVGVGLGSIVAVVTLLGGVRDLRLRLHHRILLSYFLISLAPIALLGWASAREVRLRHDEFLAERLQTDIGRARSDLEAMGPQVFDQASEANLVKWAGQRRHDVLLYRDGQVASSSRSGLVEAELLPARLPADAYEATVLQRREVVRREATLAGEQVLFGYAPVLDDAGRATATVGVPLLYDRDRVEEQLAVTGSVLLAAYLLTLVLVLVGGIYAARRLTRPLGLLAAGTRRVAAGELDVVLPPGGRDELGELVDAFNAMTRELEEATARAVHAEREMAWRRMARQVAHEIKNPLTPMRLMIQQLQADVSRDPEGAEAAVRRTAEIVLRQIEALSRIAADFAHFARLPRRTIGEVDAGALVREVVELFSGTAAEGVVVRAEVGEGLPPLRWDEEELRRVLLNLVANAVQAIQGEGRVTVRARAALRADRPGILIEVEDTGTGIRQEDRPRLFEPDFSTKTAGTGLGLAIVRRILDDMGATIDLTSEPGAGTTFQTWWPASPTPAP